MKVGESFHLAYCSNIHPGETWAEVRDALSTHLPVVRDALSVDGPFAIGLRLSADAAETLERPDELARFREFLADGAYYVFTINGFPHGRFHGERIKERVYRPDWLEDERLLYTNRLARILAAVLPDDSSLEGSVSTVPGAFKPRVPGPTETGEIARRILAHVDVLRRLRETTGKTVRLALEPEPCYHMETVAETVDFFERRLLAADARRELEAETGISLTVGRVQRHLGVCYDACHMAVEFEEPAAALRAFREAGVPIAKVQVSAALRLRHTIGDGRVDRLTPFAEPTYLHQVVGRGPSLLALSCFYTGGMFLNDAFDHRSDAHSRPDRPIPTGAVGLREVYAAGFGLLALGELILAGAARSGDAVASGALLAGAIVYYDWRHKRDPLGPIVMAICRGLTYVTAAAVVGAASAAPVLIGALAVSLYVAGLTMVARPPGGDAGRPSRSSSPVSRWSMRASSSR